MHEELMVRFTQAVVHSLWEGALIGACAWLGLKVFRGRPARQHGVLVVALLALVLCLPANVLLFDHDHRDGLAGESAGAVPAGAMAPSDLEGEAVVVIPAETLDSAAPGGSRSGERARVTSLWQQSAPWVAGLYGLGLLAMMGRLAMGLRGIRRLRKTSEPVEGPWALALERAVQSLGVRTAPFLGWSTEVAAPVLVGAVKPIVLLPVALANRLTVSQAEAVLAHELAHLRRRDQWVLAFQRAAETVLFYHPVVWWLGRELGRTREQACDDLVLAGGSQPADYAEALVLCSETRLASCGLGERPALQLAATGSSGLSLRERVLRVLGEREAMRPGRSGWLLASLVAFALLGAVTVLVPAARAQEAEVKPAPERGEALPDAEEVAAAPAERRLYVVKSGDSLFSIARAHGLSIDALRQANPNVKGVVLKVGQVLVLEAAAPGPAILVELLIAEVPADYELDADKLTAEVLTKAAGATVTSRPSVMVQSGQAARIQVGERMLDGGGAGEFVGLAIRVTPTEQGEGVVSYELNVSHSRRAEKDVVHTQQIETAAQVAWGEPQPFEVGRLPGDRKLVGTIQLRPAKPEQPPGPAVFEIRPDRKIAWGGQLYTLERLEAALPEKGGKAVVRADRETPYEAVMKLLEVVQPVYGEVSVAVAQEKPGAPDGEEPPGARLPQPDERAAQIERCRIQLQQFEAEHAALSAKYTDDHPKLRKLRRQIETARDYIAQLELAQAEEADRREASRVLLGAEAELNELLTRGLGHKHPAVITAQTRVDKARASLPGGKVDEAMRRKFNQDRIRELKEEIADLLATGMGANHPKVQALRRQIGGLQAGERGDHKPPAASPPDEDGAQIDPARVVPGAGDPSSADRSLSGQAMSDRLLRAADRDSTITLGGQPASGVFLSLKHLPHDPGERVVRGAPLRDPFQPGLDSLPRLLLPEPAVLESPLRQREWIEAEVQRLEREVERLSGRGQHAPAQELQRQLDGLKELPAE